MTEGSTRNESEELEGSEMSKARGGRELIAEELEEIREKPLRGETEGEKLEEIREELEGRNLRGEAQKQNGVERKPIRRDRYNWNYERRSINGERCGI